MSIRAARARRDESLIIIIHKTLRWEPARRETKQERCAAKQERVPSLPRGLAYVLLIPGGEPEYSTTGRGFVLESVEQKPNHFRRLRPLGRRDADVGWRTPFLFASHSLVLYSLSLFLYHCSSLPVPISYCIEPTLLDFDQHRNRPQIYCLESAHMEASSTRLMTYQECRFLLTGFSGFARSSLELSCRSLFFLLLRR